MLTGVAGALSVVMEQLKELAFAIVGATACRDLPTLNVALWLGRRSFGEGAGDSSPTARIAELYAIPLT